MQRNTHYYIGFFAVFGVAACSGDDGQPITPDAGGSTIGQGGQVFGQGGAATTQGGSAKAGTASSTGGSSAANIGGASNSSNTGGNDARGGTASAGAATGGAASNPGVATAKGGTANNTGGTSAKGGTANGGSTASKGGNSSSGGSVQSGGNSNVGGAVAKGGSSNSGGTSTRGGSSSVGGGTASGGTASGGASTCTSATWDPPAALAAGIDEVWNHTLNHGGKSYGQIIMAAANIKMYQILANKGSLNYCVRWDSTTRINATQRDQIEALIARCDKQWTDALAGWGCWPYTDVPVKVTLWAVKDRSLLDWDDSTTRAKVVVNSTAACPTDCGPWSPTNSHSNCSSAKYDEFFWLDGATTSYTGWGSATGFMMGASFFLQAATNNAATQNITVHEMGHSHGLDDFYDWTPPGFTSFVMKAGAGATVLEPDKWMLRDVWRHVRSKYGYPGP